MTAALIIASGKTNRNTNFEPTKLIGSITAVERVAILLRQAGVERIAVVCLEDDRIRKLRSVPNLTFLTAPAGGEMLDSIKTGLEYLQNKCSEAFIVCVDVPMFSADTLCTLMEAQGDVCIPAYKGRWGHPVLLRAAHFSDIMAYDGENGLKGALESTSLNKQIIEVEDPGVRVNIRRDAAYEELVPEHDAAKLRLACRFAIGKERVFYNDEVHQLLALTEELGSLSKACLHMGISLNKGRSVIATVEQQLGEAALETQQGGKHGGWSRMTPETRDMFERYSAFTDEAEQALQELFEKHFLK